MTIPKSRGEILPNGFLSLIVVVSVFLAVLNLANHVAIILSVTWLIFVAWILWSGCRDAGGVRRYLIDWLAAFAGRRFAVVPHEDAHQARIRFGYELFARRFYRKDIEFHLIESVELSPGQATSTTGRDMKDWSVALWYAHGDSEKSKKNHMLRKPDQDVYIVGPSTREEDAATLGTEFVSFLRCVGVLLIPAECGNVYVREPTGTKNIQQDAPSNR